MTARNSNDQQCEALFASAVQPSDGSLSWDAVTDAIERSVRQFGVEGCASRMAQEFGDHPEVALDRMRWVRRLVGESSPRSAEQPGTAAHCAA